MRLTNFFQKQLSRFVDTTGFPEFGISKSVLHAYLHGIRSQVFSAEIKRNLGWLLTESHPLARKVASAFMDLDQNHLGNWTIPGAELWNTRLLEKQVIDALIDLYHGKRQSLEGYFTSGSTEGNIFAAWMGRNYLKTCGASKVCLIGTDLSHYSLQKAADLLGVPYQSCPLHEKSWSMDSASLYELLEEKYRSGIRGFLVSLTAGYTQTGTSDDFSSMVKTIRRFHKTFPLAHSYIWVDAALSGMVSPFVTDFTPFLYPEIGAVVVDFHKFAQVPYPAGGIVYRSEFRGCIEREIPYLPENDNTLLGSRPGYTVAATWAMLQLRGRAGFKKIIEQQLRHKNYFVSEILQMWPKTEVITDPFSLTCGFIFHDLPDGCMPQVVADHYGFFAKESEIRFRKRRIRRVRLYKMYFLPHVTMSSIKKCLIDLRRI